MRYVIAVAQRKKGQHGGRREGAGRPRELDDPVQRWLQFERTELKAAERYARERGLSFAELVRRALRTYMRSRKGR